jgi:hypothetical protein
MGLCVWDPLVEDVCSDGEIQGVFATLPARASLSRLPQLTLFAHLSLLLLRTQEGRPQPLVPPPRLPMPRDASFFCPAFPITQHTPTSCVPRSPHTRSPSHNSRPGHAFLATPASVTSSSPRASSSPHTARASHQGYTMTPPLSHTAR